MLTIARALMMKPRLLMLDEPTLGLAPVILEQISKALERPAPVQRHHRAARRAECHLRPPHADRVYVLEHAASSGKARPPSSPRVLAQRICRSDSKDRQRQMPPHGKLNARSSMAGWQEKLLEPSVPRRVARDDFPEQQAHPAPCDALSDASVRGA